MGIFDRLFGKKESEDQPAQQSMAGEEQTKAGAVFISTGDNHMFRVVRHLTDAQKEKIERSTLLLKAAQLYMHYWTDGAQHCNDPADQTWQNQVMFFWKAEEPFPKKALPPVFETFDARHFVFTGDTSEITLKVGQAVPWFGMPGMGAKHVCELNGAQVTIPELHRLGVVEYVEHIELTGDNLDVLVNRAQCFFLVDERITQFRDHNFYVNGTPVPINVAYGVGGIHIMRKTGLR